jgi:hypothetical protein
MDALFNVPVSFSQSISRSVVYHIIGNCPNHLSALGAFINAVLNISWFNQEITSLTNYSTIV